MYIKPLLEEAERLLKNNPRDNFHDLSHHQRVWQNAQKIAASLNEKIDQEVVQVAVMWHDVMIKPESLQLGEHGLLTETMTYLRSFMQKHMYGEDFIEQVMQAIKQHTFFTKHQQTIEGKIVFDADKLDAFSPQRYRLIMSAIQTKKMFKIQTLLIANAAKVWLKKARSKYHFSISRQLHDQLIAELVKDKEAVKLAKEWGVDIQQLVK